MVYFKTLVFRFAVAVLTGTVVPFSDVRFYVFITSLNTVLITFAFDIGIVDLLNIESGNFYNNPRNG
jgi:hypothetical protein